MTYDDFELQIGPVGNDGLFVRVLSSPAGQAEEWVDPHEILDAARPWCEPSRNLTLDPLAAGSTPALVGGRLFRALFAGAVGDLFHQSLAQLAPDESRRPLRIRLRINPRDRGLAFLQRLPWELLFREATEDFLALSRSTPVVRCLDIPRPAPPLLVARPLSVLLLASQSPGSPHLGLERELAELETALAKNPDVALHVLHSPDSRSLRRALEARPVHVLHFMGHGAFDHASGEGALLLAGSDGFAETVTGRHLATKVKDFPTLRLAVLNACETAVVSIEAGHSPFTGVAASLVLGGLPAVVAMQRPIADAHAIAFSAAFYDRLAQGSPVEEALTEGRQAIHSLAPEGAEWAVPVLFLRTPTGDLFTGPAAAEVVVPEAARPGSSRTRALASGLAGMALAVLGTWVTLRAIQPSVREPDPELQKVVEPPPPDPGAEKPSEPLPKAAPAATSGRASEPRKAVVVNAGEGLRFEVQGEPAMLSTFIPSLSREATKLIDSGLLSAPGRPGPLCVAVSLRPPNRGTYQEAGQSFATCGLTADLRLCGPGGGGLGRVPVTRSDAHSGEACDSAAEALAPEVVARLAQQLKEGSI